MFIDQFTSWILSVKWSILFSWIIMILIAAAIALAASGRPRRPLRRWFGDYFVRWGLSGLFLWFIVFALWAVRELLAQNFVFLIWPIEGFIENATIWGVMLTGFLTLAFFGGTLFLEAIFDRGLELPAEGVVYYKQEVLLTPQRAKVRGMYVHLPGEPPAEVEEEATARKALEVQAEDRRRGGKSNS